MAALAATVLSEAACMLALALAVRGLRRRWPPVLAASIAMNLATHTALWFAYPLLPGGYPAKLIALEAAVAAAEAAGYRLAAGVPVTLALAGSVFANAASLLAGRLLFN